MDATDLWHVFLASICLPWAGWLVWRAIKAFWRESGPKYRGPQQYPWEND